MSKTLREAKAVVKLMNTRAAELESELLEWAMAQNFLESGEKLSVQVYFKIVTAPPPKVVVEASVSNPKQERRRYNKPVLSRRLITMEDWERIFSLPWSMQQRLVLKTLQDKGNRPTKTWEIRGGRELKSSAYEVINRSFKKHGDSYRLSFVQDYRNTGAMWWDRELMIFALER